MKLLKITSILLSTLLIAGCQFTPITAKAATDPNQDESKFEDLNERVKFLEYTFAGTTRQKDTIIFRRVNIQVVNGTGCTNTTNSLGNLIIGYNEARSSGEVKTGSHNFIIGSSHNYSSYGGVAMGFHNTITGEYASITGGSKSTAGGNFSSISGGKDHLAIGHNSSISGGASNTATGLYSSVSGGAGAISGGECSTVGGGDSRRANTNYSWAAGTLFEER